MWAPAIDSTSVRPSWRRGEAGLVSATFPLALARRGESVRIARLLGGDGVAMRLTDLGLNVGSEVRVAHRQGGRMVVVRGEIRLAIGSSLTHRILVTPVGVGNEERGEA